MVGVELDPTTAAIAAALYPSATVLAESFAEIFFGNSTTLGMPCASVSHDAILALAQAIDQKPELEITLDLESQTVIAGNARYPFTIKPGARDALMRGTWDPIAQLIDGAAAVKSVAARLPYLHFDSPS